MPPALLASALALMPVASAPPGIPPGTIAIVPAEDGSKDDPIAQTFVGAVSHAVLQTAFTPLPDPDHSRYVAKVTVSQASQGVVTSTDSRSASAQAPVYQGGSVSLRLPSGKSQLRGLIVTRLIVVVSFRTDSRIVWTGEATTARISGTPAGAPSVVAAVLAGALFQHFPRPLPGPISVP